MATTDAPRARRMNRDRSVPRRRSARGPTSPRSIPWPSERAAPTRETRRRGRCEGPAAFSDGRREAIAGPAPVPREFIASHRREPRHPCRIPRSRRRAAAARWRVASVPRGPPRRLLCYIVPYDSGESHSPVVHELWVLVVGGSNPPSPTRFFLRAPSTLTSTFAQLLAIRRLLRQGHHLSARDRVGQVNGGAPTLPR
jgi:hypothetical protein